MDITSYLLGKQAGGGSTPTLQSKDITITSNGTQTVTADSGYDGLSDVDVTTNVQPDLESKSVTITENTTTTITPTSGKDGLSQVSVVTNVSGADLSEYFTNEIKLQSYFQTIKKVPSFSIYSSLTSLYALFKSWSELVEVGKITGGANVMSWNSAFDSCYKLTNLDLSEITTTNVINFVNMFYYCTSLVSLDLSSFTSDAIPNTTSMFQQCSSLAHLDMRNFDFTVLTTFSNMFTGVPNNCEIIVNDEMQQLWFVDNWNNLTNVKTVDEYEAE